MASQQLIFAETIAGMKKAIKRKAYHSDSDSEIEQLTNRGNKLRKKARFVHEGQLARPTGPQVYKRTIEHAGFQRDIISRNPPLVDEDGYEVESDDDDERAEAAIASAAEFDPYSDVKIEHLLAPLTAASDLPDHPTLSKPFLSKTLTELTRHAGEMVQKEKASLWRIKHLLTRLSGDNTWIPCESVETDNDFALFIDEQDRHPGSILGRVIARDEGDQISTGTMVSEEAEQPVKLLTMDAHSGELIIDAAKQSTENPAADENIPMIPMIPSAGQPGSVEHGGPSGTGIVKSNTPGGGLQKDSSETILEEAAADEAMDIDEARKICPEAVLESQSLELEGNEVVDAEGGEENLPAPRRMRTRAQAQAASDNTTSRRSMTPDSSIEPFVHPYFSAPQASHPDRDVGLPQHEAEETRRLLQLYIQKQEEVCRGAQRVYDGLLRADRYRKMVMKWAKAEGHVGVNRDMSDGEDWYDKEEWGLEEDLKKGQDEEEEDAATTAKKTRTRRQ